MIDEIIEEFKAKGSKERRNWADVLSGNDGKPVAIAGRTFPILASAQISRGLPVSANALQRNDKEEFPVARRTGRWPKRRKIAQSKTKRVAQKANRPRSPGTS